MFKSKFIHSREQGFFLFLMIFAFISTSGYALLYNLIGINPLFQICLTLSIFYILLTVGFFLKTSVTLLFRLSILIAYVGFCSKIFFTGGVMSSALIELIIPPIIGFFYKPVRDRFILQGFSLVLLIGFLILSKNSLTPNLVDPSWQETHSLVIMIYVFIVVSVFISIFKKAVDKTEKLIQSEKMASLGTMAAGVAHEINNPLNFIKGGVEILEANLEKEKLSECPKPYIDMIKEGVSRASTIVSGINQFTSESDSMDELCDLHQILDNCLVLIQQKIKYNVEILKSYTSEPAVLMGNQGKLHQAFLNAISNSGEAITNNGKIVVETKSTNNVFSVSIIDNGVGIDAAHLRRISDPFFTTKEQGEGVGLGLTIAYKTFQKHHASVSVDSTRRGTNFTVRFPKEKISDLKPTPTLEAQAP